MHVDLFVITSGLFLFSLITNLISWLRLLEDKNYDLKRLFFHLKETRKGRSIFFGAGSILKWGLIFLYSSTITYDKFDPIYHAIVFVFYLILALSNLIKIYNRNLELPSISVNTISIILFAIFAEVILMLFSPLDQFLWLLIIDKLLFIFIIFSVLFLSVFFDFSSDLLINRASERMQESKKLFPIAVVGSYGRGSTKEFIARILSLKFKVLSTKDSFNNATGIARTVISDLTPSKQIFIAEMDDYKMHDIGEMMAFISPKISVVCGINSQKMSYFQKIDNIVNSKFEAVEFLPKDGVAIFNGDSEYCRALFDRTTNKKFIYSWEAGNDLSGIKAYGISENKYSLSFSVSMFGKKYKIGNVKLLGKHNIENLLPAIFIGIYMGIDFALIRKLLQEVKPLPGAMEPKVHKNGASLINDTYNANINSVLSALSYMKLYKGKKILVLEPLLELGGSAASEHESLGKEIGKVCDYVFLTNNNYFKSITKGIKEARSSCKCIIESPAGIIKFVNKNVKREDVVVFEGRQARLSLVALPASPVY